MTDNFFDLLASWDYLRRYWNVDQIEYQTLCCEYFYNKQKEKPLHASQKSQLIQTLNGNAKSLFTEGIYFGLKEIGYRMSISVDRFKLLEKRRLEKIETATEYNISALFGVSMITISLLLPVNIWCSFSKKLRFCFKCECFLRLFKSLFIQDLFQLRQASVTAAVITAFYISEYGCDRTNYKNAVKIAIDGLVNCGICSYAEKRFFENYNQNFDSSIWKAFEKYEKEKDYETDTLIFESSKIRSRWPRLNDHSKESNQLKILFNWIFVLYGFGDNALFTEASKKGDDYTHLLTLMMQFFIDAIVNINIFFSRNLDPYCQTTVNTIEKFKKALNSGSNYDNELDFLIKSIFSENEIALNGLEEALSILGDPKDIIDNINSYFKLKSVDKLSCIKETKERISNWIAEHGSVAEGASTQNEAIDHNKLVSSCFDPNFYFKNYIGMNRDDVTRNAFRGSVFDSYISSGYLENQILLNKPRSAFRTIINVIDKYFDILTTIKHFEYSQRGSLILYPEQKQTNVTQVMCDMYEELFFGNISSLNNVFNIGVDVIAELRVRVRLLISILNVVTDNIYLSEPLNAYKKAVDSFDELEDSLLSMIENGGFNIEDERGTDEYFESFDIIPCCHTLTRIVSVCLGVPEMQIKLVESDNGRISQVSYKDSKDGILLINRKALPDYIGTYELFYDLGKNICLNAAKNEPVLSGNGQKPTIKELDMTTDALTSAILKKITGVDLCNPDYTLDINFTFGYEKVQKNEELLYWAKELKSYSSLKGKSLLPTWHHNHSYKFRHSEDFASIFHFENVTSKKDNKYQNRYYTVGQPNDKQAEKKNVAGIVIIIIFVLFIIFVIVYNVVY